MKKMHVRRAMALALLLALACAIVPRLALAREAGERTHKYDKVAIEALVTPNGDLHIEERRTTTYTGAWHGIFWDISHLQAVISDETSVLGAGEYVEGKRVPYELVEKAKRTDDAVPGTYDLSKKGITTHVDLHFDKQDETAEFYVEYVMTGAAGRWADTGELDWRFMDEWDSPSNDVTCDVWIQRPDDSGVWEGENVFAWASNGWRHYKITDVTDDDIPAWLAGEGAAPARAAHVRVALDQVDSDSHANLDVIFPKYWLTDRAEIHSPRRAEAIAYQEEGVASAEEYEEKRGSSVGGIFVFFAGLAFIGVLSYKLGLGSGRLYRRDGSSGSRSSGGRSSSSGRSGGGGGSY